MNDKVNMTTPNTTVLVLRTCNGDLTSKNNFTYPSSGPVQCPDWQPTAECGKGLHGLLWGQGDGTLLNWSQDAKWLVLRVEAGDIVDLVDKVKFPKGEVVHCGDQLSATAYLLANSPADKARAVVGAHVSVGHRECALVGYKGHATAGIRGHATAGDGGHATAGDGGQATAGNEGQATAGYMGHATAGYGGQATAGNEGQATAGYMGHATAGYGGHATAGDGGTISIKYWDSRANRFRVAIGYVGEDSILANVAYKVENGKLVRV